MCTLLLWEMRLNGIRCIWFSRFDCFRICILLPEDILTIQLFSTELSRQFKDFLLVFWSHCKGINYFKYKRTDNVWSKKGCHLTTAIKLINVSLQWCLDRIGFNPNHIIISFYWFSSKLNHVVLESIKLKDK